MKVYLYYIVANDMYEYYAVLPSHVITEDGLNYALYAHTAVKTEAKIFEQTRKKDLFVRKVTNMTKKEYRRFTELHDDEALSYHDFPGSSISNNKIISKDYFILSTVMEYDCVSFHGSDYFEEKMNDIEDIYLLNIHKIIKPNIIKAIGEEVFDKESTLLQMKIPLDEYESNELPLNYLEIYNDMFANTYKEGGVYENALLSIL